MEKVVCSMYVCCNIFLYIVWKLKCCLLIQNQWRSFIVLKEYRNMQETIEPKSPTKKEKFYLRKFQKINCNLVSSINQRSDDIDSFLLSINNSIAISRSLFDTIKNNENKNELNLQQHCNNHIDKKWEKIKQTAINRNETDCSICMELLSEKKCVLLDCTHIFHSDCIQSFERFSLRSSTICPICRSEDYDKIDFNVSKNNTK